MQKFLYRINIFKNGDIGYWKKVFAITWPAYIELVLSAMFGMVDTMMVGNIGGQDSSRAIASVGLSGQPFNLLIAVFAAINVGTTTIVAWNVGAKNIKQAENVARQTVMFNIVFGVILGLVGVFAAAPIMRFMGASAEIIDNAVEYFQIICYGIAFQGVTMGITAALRGCGKTRPPMFYNVFSNFVNVILNYVMIFGKLGFPKMGVAGAAWATTISRVIGCLIALAILFKWKESPIRLSFKQNWKPRLDIIKSIFSVGIPSAGEQFVIQSGLMIFTRTVSVLGVTAYAAHQIALNINSIAFATSQSFGVAATTLTGISVGSKNYNLADKFISVSKTMGNITSAGVGLLFIFLGRYIARLYTDDLEVLTLVVPIFYMMALLQPIQSTNLSINGGLRGAGDTMYPLYACIFGIWIFRVVAAMLFVHVLGLGLMGAWLALLLDQTTRSIVVYLRYKTGKWRYIKELKENKKKNKL